MLNFHVMSIEETCKNALDGNMSIARFGDGEFLLIKNHSIRFQKKDPELQKELSAILHSNKENLLICLPPVFTDNHELKEGSRKWWRKYLLMNYFFLKKRISKTRTYGNTFLSRPYLSYVDKSEETMQRKFSLIRELWEGKDLLIVEGSKTRLGYRNALFDNAKSIERIECPDKNAYSIIGRIEAETLKHCKGKLVIFALGPTATVLVARFADKNIQSFDLGHLDIEYEWYLNKTLVKTPIPNKIVNEAGSDSTYHEDAIDPEFTAQIISVIK